MKLCGDLNERGARYLVISGFAVRAAGYDRRTMDIDLLVEPGADNEARVIEAVARLPTSRSPSGGVGGTPSREERRMRRASRP